MKLNWVTLKVGDLEKSLLFYTNLLGLDIAATFGDPDHQIVMLGKADETKIELILEPNTKIENPGKGISLGLETDDVERLVSVLQESGCKVTGPIAPMPQIRFFFVQDPDGYNGSAGGAKNKVAVPFGFFIICYREKVQPTFDFATTKKEMQPTEQKMKQVRLQQNKREIVSILPSLDKALLSIRIAGLFLYLKVN